MKRYLINLGDATSQWVNALFGGDANHSISGDAYRFGRWQLMFWIDTIFKTVGQREHCKRSYLHDVARARELIQEHDARGARDN